jgi:hypothetical protein
MSLEIGRMEGEKWDTVIMPSIQKGLLKERKDLQLPGFLMIHQLFDTIIEDENGRLYTCTAWIPPAGSPYVNVEEFLVN